MKTVTIQNGKQMFKRLTLMVLPIIFIPFGVIEAQTISETIEKKVRFDNPDHINNVLSVYNIKGDVTVEGYDGEDILITAEKWVEANDSENAKKSLDELKVVIEEANNEVLVYVDAPFVEIKRRNGSISYNMNRSKDDYNFRIGITIQVPTGTNLQASTITEGDVIVRNVMTENILASNVNGDVSLEMIAGKTKAITVNGNVRASYRQAPDQDSEYKTVNGSIEVEYPTDLSANVHFKSMHGDLYTDFTNIERLESLVETNKGNRREGTRWRINKFSPIRIGDGGPELQFHVVNGNVYLKQKKS